VHSTASRTPGKRRSGPKVQSRRQR
jgi:hypothetical protein